MISQLRIYTINRGMMDSWLKLFEEHIRPIHQGLAIPIEASWVNADRTEFLWVRSFNTVEERKPPTLPLRGAPPSATCPPATSPRWKLEL